MRRQLSIVIESGDTTCFMTPGKPCSWIRTSHYGTRWSCGIFGKEPNDSNGDGTGWLLRLPECLDAEIKNPPK